MAKKRKRQDEIKEERVYRPPEFDRQEYVRTEVGVSKATVIAAIFSAPMGLAAMLVMPAGGAGAGLLVGLAGMGALWFLVPRVGIDVAPFKPMQWAGIMSTYFMVFLVAWVVLCNPPFNDLATPEIRNVRVSWGWGSSNVTVSDMGGLVAIIPVNVTEITVRAQVTDNVRVAPGTVTISRGGGEAVQMAQTTDPKMYEHSFAGVEQFHTFRIAATDTKGNAHPGYGFTIIHG